MPRVRIETSFETWIFASMVKAATAHILLGGLFSLGTHHPIPSSTPPNITHSQPLPKTSTKVTNVPSFSPGSAASHMADASGKFHFINANTVNTYGSREGTHFEWGRSIYIFFFYLYIHVYTDALYTNVIYSTSLKARLSIAIFSYQSLHGFSGSPSTISEFCWFTSCTFFQVSFWHHHCFEMMARTSRLNNYLWQSPKTLPTKSVLDKCSRPVGFHIRTEEFRLKETNDYPL